jgi:hypothetical protein
VTQSPQTAPDDLERQLAAMTAWRGGDDGDAPWRAALERARPLKSAGGRDWLYRLSARKVLTPALAAAAIVVLVGVISVAVLVPSLGRARQSSRFANADAKYAHEEAATAAAQSRFQSPGRADFVRELDTRESAGAHQPATPAPVAGGANVVLSRAGPLPVVDRQVIRKATIDVQTPDVAAAFMKAMLVISEAGGEYVENSSLSGEGATAAGSLTLRIAASRLSDVLNQLRPLGHVISETSSGDDVTDRVVDVEARLRNEQRVETELLELLAKRQDAPLKEILELRASISSIRERIEQLTAQRERLGRLVALATVLVTIRADDAPLVARGKGIGAYFSERITEAWRSALRFLTDSVALIVSIAVGGIIWWLLVAALVLAIVLARRRAVAAAAVEPVPVE